MVWPLELSIGLFVLAALTIGFAGARLAGLADQLADDTGLGEAVFGGIFLGATTSLSGSVTSVVAAAQGHPQLAIGNAIGGIAVQTAFLAIADLAYFRANLEHAAASLANIMQGSLLVVILAIVLLTMSGPDFSLWSISFATPVIVAAYVFGVRLLSQTSRRPMWRPQSTTETVVDQPIDVLEGRPGMGMKGRVVQFIILAVLVGGAGWLLTRSGISIADQTGLSETIIGTLFTSTSTSLPELVTAVSAVRRGALTLAVSDIIGGNVFDTLMFPMADLAYRGGSIYHALSPAQLFWIALAILLTGVLLMGLLRRERYGIANIGLESVLILLFYVGGATVLFFTA